MSGELVLVESPFAGDLVKNIAYAKACVLDCLHRGEFPYASHLFFPQVLDDDDVEQRALGIAAGLAWGEKADFTAAYLDLGISRGMKQGIAAAIKCGRLVVERKLGGEWASVASDAK